MANYTQKAILQTFENMLREMPFEKITVSALVARCEISSNTFYYHYRDIYDLLDRWLGSKIDNYLKDAYTDGMWKDSLKLLLHDIRDNKEIVNHIFHSVSRDRFEQYVFNNLEEKVYLVIQARVAGRPIPEETMRLMAGMCCYTLFGFLTKYIWDGMRADVDEYFDRLGELLDSSLKCYAARQLFGQTGFDA